MWRVVLTLSGARQAVHVMSTVAFQTERAMLSYAGSRRYGTPVGPCCHALVHALGALAACVRWSLNDCSICYTRYATHIKVSEKSTHR